MKKNNSIYLDWNAIQILKGYFLQKDKSSQEKWNAFLEVKKKYNVPLSEAHFQDLANSNNDIENQNDLNFLHHNYSDETFIISFQNDNPPYDYIFKVLNRNELKNEYQKDIDIYTYHHQSTKNLELHKHNAFQNIDMLNVSFPAVSVDISKIPDQHFLKKYLIENNNSIDSSMMKKIAKDFIERNNDPIFIQNFIETMRILKVSSDPVMDLFPDKCKEFYHEYATAFIEWLDIKRATLTQRDIDQTINFFKLHFKIINKNYDQSSILDKINIAYSLLNFTDPRGYCGENFSLKKGKMPNNSFRDSYHLICAQDCEYLVTNDNNLIKKAEILKQLGISNVETIKLDNLLN